MPTDIDQRIGKEDGITSEPPCSTSAPSTTTSPRHLIGNSINTLTGAINDNIIIARYSTIAAISLLTVYGISKTPIFFRYKNVCDLPSSLFANRRTIHGRIVHVVENDVASFVRESDSGIREEPIICLVRQLSPMARLLNRSSFNFMVGMHPSSQLNGKDKSQLQHAKDLLKVEIAGIKAPPFYNEVGREGVNEWLKGLAFSRAPVSCTLLSRRILKPVLKEDEKLNQQHQQQQQHGQPQKTNTKKDNYNALDPDIEQVAVAKVSYRPGISLFRKDLASSLLSFGRANIASGIRVDIPFMPTIDGSTKLGHIEADAKYLEDLGKCEFEAVKAKKGMWGISCIRNSRQDLVEEADFEVTAGFWKKIWRRIRKE